MPKHPFPPLYDENSKVLILGSFPSVKSREQIFFYGHPQNRFWKVVSAASLAPARAIGADDRKGSLESGKDAYIIITDGDFNILKTIIGGEVRYEA